MGARRAGIGIGIALVTSAAFHACWVWKEIPDLEGADASVDPHDAGVDSTVDVVTGCDADVMGDPGNCGSCGHDCLGGACEAGVCRPAVLQTGLAYALITIENEDLYLAEENGTIIRRDATGATQTIAQGQASPQRVALDATHIYWGTGRVGKPGGLHRMPRSGCTSCIEDILLVEGSVPNVIPDGDFIYFATSAASGALWRVKKGAICGTPDAGSPDCEVLVSGLSTPSVVELVGSFFYVVCVGTGPDYYDGSIVRIPKTGCNGVPNCPLVLAADQHWPSFMVANSERVYWSNYVGKSTMMVAADGSGAPFALGSVSSSGIDIDDTHVYWITKPVDVGAVRRASLDGNGIEFVANELPSSVYDLRVTNTALYFSTVDSVMILAK